MNATLHNRLVWLAQVWLPAVGTLYAALAPIWNLPYVQQVVSSIVAVDAALGTVLKAWQPPAPPAPPQEAPAAHFVQTDEGKAVFDFHVPPEELLKKDSFVVKVAQADSDKNDLPAAPHGA